VVGCDCASQSLRSRHTKRGKEKIPYPERGQARDKAAEVYQVNQGRTVLVRREQTLLRQYLFGENEWESCAICENALPVFLLVTAPIKPRAACSDMERRDYANNVVPMCVLGCDALFERGVIIAEDPCTRAMAGEAERKTRPILETA
jgi:hypothetical protein